MTNDEKRLIRHLIECVRTMMEKIPACAEIQGRDDALQILHLCGQLADLRDEVLPANVALGIPELTSMAERRDRARAEISSVCGLSGNA